jgi:hypothetical protein
VHDTEPTTTPCPQHPNKAGNPWCIVCGERILDTITALPRLHDQLLASSGHATRRPTERQATRLAPGSLSPEFDHADEIARTLDSWADAWADHLGADRARTLDPRASAAYLQKRHRRVKLVEAPFAYDLGQELVGLTRTAERLLGGGDALKPTRTWLAGPCPNCSRTNLYRLDGGDQVHCTTIDCRLDITHDEYLAQMWWLTQACEGAA